MNPFCVTPEYLQRNCFSWLQNKLFITAAFSMCLFMITIWFCFYAIRALDVWGSHEALARERNLRKEVEREFQESRLNICLLINQKHNISVHNSSMKEILICYLVM